MPFRSLPKLLAFGLLLSWAAVGQAAPASGAMISNTAFASFVDSTSGTASRLNSNTVNTQVAALEALALAANQTLVLATGAPFATSHTLTNTGNADATIQVSAVVAAGSGFSPLNLQVIRDVNGNGRADPGEPALTAPFTLPSGASMNLLVTGQVPGTATVSQTAQVVLSAVTQLQVARASNTDTLRLTNGAAVQAVLSATPSAAAPSGVIDWTAVSVNNGSSSSGATSILIDGAAVTDFVLRAPVPANTTFDSASSSSNVGARTLYHVVGSAAKSYVSTLPAGAQVDAVAWAMPDLPAGGSLQGQFRVKVNGNAAGSISDTAYADWSDGGAAQLSTSNTVLLALPARPADIAFYTSDTYASVATQNMPGGALYVQSDAAMCNADPSHVETVQVKVTSQLTGDTETFTAVETGPNTGLFRIQPNVPTANAATHVVAAGDGILEVLRNDLVTATLSACGSVNATASTSLLIDPSGVVYDSRTNEPVAGATVTLVDVTGSSNGGRPGSGASVLQMDGVTAAPSTVVTGADGVYSFPLVKPGTYQVIVTPPNGLVFPSSLPASQQPADRVLNAPGSFGGSFSVGAGAVRFDVPLDTGGRSGIFVQKTANKASAEVGDFVDYSVTVKNVTGVQLALTQVRDSLPAGFAYVAGTARLDGAKVADPAGGSGPRLTFSVGGIAAGGQRVLTYRVRVGAGSQSGNGTNTAQAFAGALLSNVASVRVQVLGGVFSNDAYVIGKVFADCRRDGVQADNDPGIPGVRIYLEDGTYAVTDEEGKYSFYGLTPRTHVAKLDATTLPAGATLEVLDHRNALDAGSRFVDLRNGELQKANFAIAGCEPALREQIAARRQALRNPAEMVQAAGLLLSPTQASTTDARTLPASGAIGLPGAGNGTGATASPSNGVAPLGAVADPGGSVAASLQGVPQPIFRPADSLLHAHPAAPTSAPTATPEAAADSFATPLEDLLPKLSAETAFVGLQEGQRLATAQTRVRVKGPRGAKFELTVNGEPIPEKHVGKRTELAQTGVSAWEYIGVDLRPGRNTLELKATDPFGNARGTAKITVLAPGALAKVLIDVPAKPVADATTPVPVTITLQDADGLPVMARTLLTLQASAGQWQVEDTDPHQPGTQVLLEGGSARYLLLPPAQPGKVDLGVLAGTVKSTASIEFVPQLRPLIAAGIVEGTINLRNLNPSALVPAQSGDAFENEIRSVSRSFDDGKAEAGARAAVFLKGKVLGSSLLTVAYDSDKAADTRLFRDIQPNRFYPVYGDSSARGFDGQSTGKLYVLLQNGSNYALLGDFSTQSDNPARQLTQYSRSLNGAKTHWSDGTLGVDAFASRTSATQFVQEVRGNGTSGPFQLNINGVVNSEQVHVITRSRDQPALVLKDTPLAAFTDYAIEPTTGLLLLKAPVPSVDSDLNPVFVRISYDIDSGGPTHTVAGAEVTARVGTGTTVGAVAITDQDPANRQRIEGLTISSKLGEKTALLAEAARSQTDLQGQGSGERVDFSHEAQGVQAHAWGVHTSAGFYNPNSPQSAGQSEYGAKAGYTLNESNRIVAEALKTTNSVSGAEQVGADLKLEHSFPGNINLEVGVRRSSANAQASLSSLPSPGTDTAVVTPASTPPTTSTAQAGYTSARVKLTAPVPGVPQATVSATAEQAIDGSDGHEVGFGADYALNATTKLYARHDLINSLNGPYTLNPDVSRYTTVAGVNTTVADGLQVFNEYRVGDAIDGRTSQAALGLRKVVKVADGFNVSASLQRVKPMTGPTSDDSTAVALGAEYTQPANWKASGQAQWQTSTTSRSWLLNGALVNKLSPEWTLLNRFLVNDQANTSGGVHDQATAQSGVAFRPVANDQWNALGRIEYKRDRDTTIVQGADESAWILSTHLNVQPTRDWVMNARYAAKLAHDRADGLSTTSFTQLLGGRSVWDLGTRWDAGVQAYLTWGNGARQAALGLEVGYLVGKNLWVSAGYNVLGFSAADLAGDATTIKGPYVRLRYKFDENAFESAAEARKDSDAHPAGGAKP